MKKLNDRDALLAVVRLLQDEFERVVAAAGDERVVPPDDGAAWTRKDVLAHLTSWRLTTAARLEAGLRDEEPVMPWPGHLDEEDDLDEINGWFDAANCDKPLTQVARESHETFDRVERALAESPDDVLFAPGRFPWLSGEALGPAVVRGTWEHHQEHVPDVEALLRTG